jgi:hypothetical protein
VGCGGVATTLPIRGVIESGGVVYALAGLTHMSTRRGATYRVQRGNDGRWTAEVHLDLGATPNAVAEETPCVLAFHDLSPTVRARRENRRGDGRRPVGEPGDVGGAHVRLASVDRRPHQRRSDPLLIRTPLEFRVLYTLEEWGKMSNAFFPVVFEALYRK